MRDYLERNRVRERLDDIRYHLGRVPPEFRVGVDLEPTLKGILARVPAPEVSYRVDQLTWYDTPGGSCKSLCLPEYNHPDRDAILPLRGPSRLLSDRSLDVKTGGLCR